MGIGMFLEGQARYPSQEGEAQAPPSFFGTSYTYMPTRTLWHTVTKFCIVIKLDEMKVFSRSPPTRAKTLWHECWHAIDVCTTLSRHSVFWYRRSQAYRYDIVPKLCTWSIQPRFHLKGAGSQRSQISCGFLLFMRTAFVAELPNLTW